MPRKLTRDQIVDYATWTDVRLQQQPAIFAAKKLRRIFVGEYLTFLFENSETVRYQVQEMMRIEKIVREKDIAHEIETYNELIGGTGELGCALLIEIDDEATRDELLTAWLGLERTLYLQLDDGSRATARFDERQVGETRLSSVQYLTFDTGGRTPVAVGVDHPAYTDHTVLTDAQRDALARDLAS